MIRVLSIIDSLIAAGAERMAVNIANGLALNNVESHLCATHYGGPLEDFINHSVKFIILNKRNALDLKAFFRLLKYVRKNKINIIHAHSSSIFWAVLVKILTPKLKVVWHDHFGFSEQLNKRPSFLLGMISRHFDHTFAVNGKLLNFAQKNLRVGTAKSSFLPNFADLKFSNMEVIPDIPNIEATPKMICLANLRPQKDHHNLLDAFKIVQAKYLSAQLYLVGGHFNDEYYNGISQRIRSDLILTNCVHILGSRNDVAPILSACDIGVLSSVSEGLPVSVLEYGLAGLPVVCTKVGDCTYVLDNGNCGRLVDPGNYIELAKAIIELLDNPDKAKSLGNNLKERINSVFSINGAVTQILDVYNKIMYRAN